MTGRQRKLNGSDFIKVLTAFGTRIAYIGHQRFADTTRKSRRRKHNGYNLIYLHEKFLKSDKKKGFYVLQLRTVLQKKYKEKPMRPRETQITIETHKKKTKNCIYLQRNTNKHKEQKRTTKRPNRTACLEIST